MPDPQGHRLHEFACGLPVWRAFVCASHSYGPAPPRYDDGPQTMGWSRRLRPNDRFGGAAGGTDEAGGASTIDRGGSALKAPSRSLDACVNPAIIPVPA